MLVRPATRPRAPVPAAHPSCALPEVPAARASSRAPSPAARTDRRPAPARPVRPVPHHPASLLRLRSVCVRHPPPGRASWREDIRYTPRKVGHHGGEAGREPSRLEGAEHAHRRAVDILRGYGDNRWPLALALNNLATVLIELDRRPEALGPWADALHHLTGFTDPAAVCLRARIEHALHP